MTLAHLTNVDVVVYALAELGGAEKTIYSEDIAAHCFELAPSKFCWRLEKYRRKGWPDKYVARTALEDAKKGELGGLVEGAYALESAKDGWRLTTAGVKWFRANRSRIAQALDEDQPIVRSKDAGRTRRLVQNQALFQRFKKEGRVDPSLFYEFTDMLTCSPDAGPEIVAAKFRQLEAKVEMLQDKELSEFLRACGNAFPTVRAETAGDEQ